MSEKLHPSLQPQIDSVDQHLNQQLKEINSFNNSSQLIKDFKNFDNHECKKYKTKSKRYKNSNNLILSVDCVLVLAVS